MREELDRIVAEMVDRGVHFDDAQKEFERRFIARVVAHCDGNVGKAADALGMHRNTLTRKVTALRINVRRGAA
jgi:DNA-binding NtrC family response regulator